VELNTAPKSNVQSTDGALVQNLAQRAINSEVQNPIIDPKIRQEQSDKQRAAGQSARSIRSGLADAPSLSADSDTPRPETDLLSC